MPDAPGAVPGEGLDEALRLAASLVAAAGELAREALDGGELEQTAKGERGDVVTPVDRAAEALIVAGIRARFPDHAIRSEEAGSLGPDSEWTWLVDPLDGTNNLALGLPLVGACATLLRGNRPVLAAIHDGARGQTFTAVRGAGAHRDGARLALGDAAPPQATTVSWIQGYGVAADDPLAERVRSLLGLHFKRTLTTWAPAIDWALIAEGKVGAAVVYRSEPEDSIPGRLLVEEAGGSVRDFSGRLLEPGENAPELVLGNPEVTAAIASILKTGLTGLANRLDSC
jgi:myo-inositol-1(or 4)-monophosphatase